MVTVDCSSRTTMNVSDNFTCVCKGLGGKPPADVTWFKGNKQKGGPGKEEQTLRLVNVKKDANGTYTCVAESHEVARNETTIVLVVNCKYIDTPIN